MRALSRVQRPIHGHALVASLVGGVACAALVLGRSADTVAMTGRTLFVEVLDTAGAVVRRRATRRTVAGKDFLGNETRFPVGDVEPVPRADEYVIELPTGCAPRWRVSRFKGKQRGVKAPTETTPAKRATPGPPRRREGLGPAQATFLRSARERVPHLKRCPRLIT